MGRSGSSWGLGTRSWQSPLSHPRRWWGKQSGFGGRWKGRAWTKGITGWLRLKVRLLSVQSTRRNADVDRERPSSVQTERAAIEVTGHRKAIL